VELLHVIQRYWPYVGGSELYFQVISERFAAAGNRVRLATTDAWDIEHFWAAGKRRVAQVAEQHGGVAINRYPVRRLPLVSPLYYPAMRRLMAEVSRLPGSAPLLRQLCRSTPLVPAMARAFKRDSQPLDLIHVTNIPFDALIYHAEGLARRRGVPLVITPFTHLGEPQDRRIRKYYTMRHQVAFERAAAAVVVQTDLERDYLASLGVPRAKMHKIGVGIDPQDALGGDGPRFRQQHNLGDRPLVYYLGVTAFDKGTVHLVEAMRKLWAGGSDAALVVAGNTMSHFVAYLDRLPAADRQRVLLLGPIEQQAKLDLFAAADVGVMTSRTDSFGLFYLEAWVNGTPVIGARAGGVPEVVTDGKDGLLVRFGDVDDIAAKIALLIRDKPLAASLAAAGKQKVYDRMNWQRVFNELDALYRELVAK